MSNIPPTPFISGSTRTVTYDFSATFIFSLLIIFVTPFIHRFPSVTLTLISLGLSENLVRNAKKTERASKVSGEMDTGSFSFPFFEYPAVFFPQSKFTVTSFLEPAGWLCL